ncbi:MAG: NTP transferase domain-containing protein [Euryarchaeota archaeon]|nr:NTP transferase domain-containing protein [Euryarchaeota archaeon]
MAGRFAALVTAGGRGTRIAELGAEKPLVEVLGRKLIDRAIDIATSSDRASAVYVSTSEHTPLTESYLEGRDVRVIRTSGRGYVEDLHDIMRAIEEEAVVIIPVDMPLITPDSMRSLISSYISEGKASLTVALDPATVRSLGLDVTHTEVMGGREVTFCGVSVVRREDMLKDDYIEAAYLFTDSIDFAVNVNTSKDLAIAEGILEKRNGQGVSGGYFAPVIRRS